MKRLGIAGIIVLLVAFASLAQSSMDAEGIANGKTVLWFHGTEVTASIESDLTVEGSLEVDGAIVPFTATGTAVGSGEGDSAIMTLAVWLVIDATGETADGTPITLRGGLAGSSDDADLTGSALGSAAGPFFAVVTLGENRYRALGTAEGSATGDFVVPDDPLTMQMEGIGTYTLIGDLAPDTSSADGDSAHPDYVEHLPWDPSSWPPDLLTRLLAVLDGTYCTPEDDQPEDEPEPIEV